MARLITISLTVCSMSQPLAMKSGAERIQQLWIVGRLTLRHKIIKHRRQPAAEEHIPEPIGHYARSSHQYRDWSP